MASTGKVSMSDPIEKLRRMKKNDLLRILSAILYECYQSDEYKDEQGNPVWDRDKEVSGGDLCDAVCGIFYRNGLTPKKGHDDMDWSYD